MGPGGTHSPCVPDCLLAFFYAGREWGGGGGCELSGVGRVGGLRER